MSISRIIADSDDEEDQLTSEALSTCSGPPPAMQAAHMFTHVASPGPTPGLCTPGIQDTPVVVAGVSTLSQDATRLASSRSNSTDPAYFAALYSREQRAALGQDSSLASALGAPTTATVAVNQGLQQRQFSCISDLTVSPQGLNSVVKGSVALNSLSSQQSCSVPNQQRLNSTSDGPDAQKPQNISMPASIKSTILSETDTAKATMDPWAVPDTDGWMCSGEKMIKPPRMTISTQKRRQNPNTPEGLLGASDSVHPHLRINNPRRNVNSMADELSTSSAGLENNNLGVVPDISALQPNIPSTASYTPLSRQIYVAPSVLTASQRNQYREVSIAPSPKTGSDADISFEDPGGLSVNLNQRTLGIHLNAVPSSYTPTVQFSTPSEFASPRHSPPIENTLELSPLHQMTTAKGYTGQGQGSSNVQGEILPTQEFTPEKPKGVSKLAASTPLTKKRKLDRRRDSSPDIILVTEAQALTPGCSTSARTNKPLAQHGDIDLYAFDSSPPPPPPASAKKQRRIAPRTEEVDELAQPYVGPPQNLTPLRRSMQRPELEQKNDANKWQPVPAPMAVMEVSRSTQGALALNAKITSDRAQVEPSVIAEQSGGMEQRLEEPPRSGRSVHDQIADSEDEDEGDPPLVRLAPDTGKGKVPKEKEAEVPDTQSFSQHTSVSLVLGEEMGYKIAEKIQAEQAAPEAKGKATKKKAPSRKQKATSKGLPGKKHEAATAAATEEPQRKIPKLPDIIAISDDESTDDDNSPAPISAPVSTREPELEPGVKPEPKPQLNSEPPQVELPAKTAKSKTKKSIAKKPPIKKANSKKGTAKSKKSATPDPPPIVEIPLSKPETSGTVAPSGDIQIPPSNPTPREPAESAPVQGRSEPAISTPTTKSTDSVPTPNGRQDTLMVGKPHTEASQAKPVISMSVSKPVYRVGLSRRSRIAPLLKIVRKT